MAGHLKLITLDSLFLRNYLTSENEKIVTLFYADCPVFTGLFAKQAG